MAKLYYGYWNDKLIDNRDIDKSDRSSAPIKIDTIINKKNVKAFVNWNGFLVFDEDTDILAVLIKYMKDISEYGCCGRCFAGRTGTRVLSEYLKTLYFRENFEDNVSRVFKMISAIYNSSKCTVAPTSTIPLKNFLEHFQDEIKGMVLSKLQGTEYVKHLTTPCTYGCNANIKIPEFIESIKDFRPLDALSIIKETMPIPGVCGRVCPHPCESNCRRGLLEEPVNIMALKRYAWDYEYYHNKGEIVDNNVESTGKRVCVVGGGPSGLTAAYYLALKGHKVKILEMLPKAGGMVAVGIPEYRQPRDLLQAEIDAILSLGVEIEYNKKLGSDVSLNEIKENYDAVLLTVGAFKSRAMGVEGEKLGYKGVLKSGIDFLQAVALGKEVTVGKKVVVVGGGNTAIDCVRTIVRLGVKDVNLVYRRSRNEMPAEAWEVDEAEAEGVKLHFLVNPVKVIAENNDVVSVECVKMQLGAPDESGRRRPVPIPDSNFTLDCDTIIPAIGQFPNLDFLGEEDGIAVTKWNTIHVEEDLYMTATSAVFAAGDCEWGPDTVVRAVSAGRRAASMIDRYMMEGKPYLTDEENLELLLYKNRVVFDKDEQICEPATIPRVKQHALTYKERANSFDEVEKPFTSKQAYLEASRCMRCMRMAMLVLERVEEDN